MKENHEQKVPFMSLDHYNTEQGCYLFSNPVYFKSLYSRYLKTFKFVRYFLKHYRG